MLNVPKKTLVLIAVLITITVFLLALAISLSNQKQAVTTQAPITPTPTVEKTANIAFSPTSLDLSTGSSSAVVNLNVDTGKVPITGVQIELVYDPAVITDLKLLPADTSNSLFGEPGNYMNLFTDSRTPGDITYAIAINPTGNPIGGSGSVGKISFNVVKSKPTATISFGKKTIVTAKTTQESILNLANPLTIKLK
ncbi:MAG: cohesin domain-containing protein [Candidatus Levyibacteriota bacterium]